MALPNLVRQTLADIGQVAAEVQCQIEDYREFVSVSATSRERVMNAEHRFPYLNTAQVIYRAIRFRVKSTMIQDDADVGPEDLVGLQEIFLPNEEAVEFVMGIWHVPLDSLLSPREVEIPV